MVKLIFPHQQWHAIQRISKCRCGNDNLSIKLCGTLLIQSKLLPFLHITYILMYIYMHTLMNALTAIIVTANTKETKWWQAQATWEKWREYSLSSYIAIKTITTKFIFTCLFPLQALVLYSYNHLRVEHYNSNYLLRE